MYTRRSFVAAAALVVGAAPLLGHTVTEVPVANRWPVIQGPGVDPQRTRFINGRGVRSRPENSHINRPDLSFLRNTDDAPSMAMVHGMVLARAMGPGFPLVAMDAATGKLAWERDETLSILGISDDKAFIVTAPKSDNGLPILKAVDVTVLTDVWAAGEREMVGSVVVPGQALVYTRVNEDSVDLVSRELESGRILWSTDITDDVDQIPGTLATDGDVVVGVNVHNNISTVMNAWDVTTGEVRWSVSGTGLLSSPAFWNDSLVVATIEGVKQIDPSSGEVISEIEMPLSRGGIVKLLITDDALIVADNENLHSIDWDSGVVNWSRSPRLAPMTQEIFVCDGVILRLEKATATSIDETVLRGYSLVDGRLELEYLPVDAEGNELNAAAFLIGSEQLFLATNQGLGTWFPSDEPLDQPQDPMFDEAFSDEELGFSYSWSTDWKALGSTQMTPNGLILQHDDLDKYVAQFAGPASGSDYNFEGNWHAVFGPYDTTLLSVQPTDAPDLPFVPENAEVLAVQYHTTLSELAENRYGLRVLIPLADDNRLVFEYLQDGLELEEGISTFATFFEHLVID